MFELHFAPIPDDFALILRSNMQTSSQFYGELRFFIAERRDLSFVVKRTFQDIDSSGQIDKIIKALGWFGVRNRLGHAYLHKKLEGDYPVDFDSLLTKQVTSLEEKFQRYSVDGYSRFFMFAFSIQMMMMDLKVSKPDENLERYLPVDDLLQLLSVSKSRIIKIDWLLLVLIKLRAVLGQEFLLKKLMSGMSWDDLFDLLGPEHQHNLTQNLMRYATVIGESEMLVGEFIQ